MLHRDYLMRQVQQLAQVLAKVLFFKGKEQTDEARDAIREAFKELPGLADLLRPDLSREQVLDACRTESGVSVEKAVPLGDLLQERALLQEDADEPASGRPYFQYALWLYEAALEQGGAALPWDIQDRLVWLREQIAEGSDA